MAEMASAPGETLKIATHRLVSIVVPCYGGERFLGEALESCATQTYAAIEVIVVDDFSPDRCGDVAARMAARDARFQVVRHQKNLGVSGAFNSGFARATGHYLTRLAQDDAWEADAIARLVQVLECNPGVGLTYGDFLVCNERGIPVRRQGVPEPEDALRWGNFVGLAVMWRRAVWERVGPFESRCDTAEDYDYWLRASRSYAFARCDGPPLMRVRLHSGMGSRQYAVRQGRATIAAVKRWRSDLGWRDGFAGRRALSKAHLTAALCYVDAGVWSHVYLELLWSFALWPFPFGRRDPQRLNRLRFLAAQVRDLLGRTLLSAGGTAPE